MTAAIGAILATSGAGGQQLSLVRFLQPVVVVLVGDTVTLVEGGRGSVGSVPNVNGVGIAGIVVGPLEAGEGTRESPTPAYGLVCRLELCASVPGECVPDWYEWVMLETNRPLRTQVGTGQVEQRKLQREKQGRC